MANERSTNFTDLPATDESAALNARQRVQRVLPWVASVAGHAAVIVLGILTPWTVRVIMASRETPAAVVADFNNLTLAPLEGVADSLDAAYSRDAFDAALSAASPEGMPDAADLLAGAGGLTDDAATPGASGATGLGTGLGGDDALQGFIPRGQDGGEVSFGGLRGSNARNIVYVVDASGSMLTYLPIVIDELVRSIDKLSENQSFAVTFFQQNEALLVPGPHDPDPGDEDARRRRGRSGGHDRPRLLPATPENKLHVFNWIDLDARNVRATGRSNPIAAIRLALEQLEPQPDVVFILSTDITGIGEYEVDQEELLALIRRANRDKDGGHKAVIKTIEFVYEDRLDTLRKIAEENGGPDGHRFLSREELGMGR